MLRAIYHFSLKATNNQSIKCKSLHLHAFNFDAPGLSRLVQHFLSHINIKYGDHKCHIREYQYTSR